MRKLSQQKKAANFDLGNEETQYGNWERQYGNQESHIGIRSQHWKGPPPTAQVYTNLLADYHGKLSIYTTL